MLSSSKVIWKKRPLAPRPRLAFSAGTSGRRRQCIVLGSLTRSTAPRRDDCSLIRASWSCGKAGGPFPQSLTMCGSKGGRGEMERMCLAGMGRPNVSSHAEQETQKSSLPLTVLTKDSLEIDQGKNSQTLIENSTRSSREPDREQACR